MIGNRRHVIVGLLGDAAERDPLRLGLDDPDRPLVDIEQVVGAAVAGRHDRLSHGDAGAGEEVQTGATLHEPASIGQLAVDQDTGALLGSHHVIGGTEYMFSPDVPLFLRLLSLFHVVTPPLLVWAIWRLGYDPRGWKWQAVTCWIVVPINYFWRPEYDVNWARGLFFRTQHAVPAAVYLLAYLVVVPLVIYFPTHLLLLRLSQRWKRQG